MAPSFGFDVPLIALVLGFIVLAIGLFVFNGLNVVTYAGILIAFAGIIALFLAVVATPEPEHGSGGHA